MKKILSLFLAVILMFSALSVAASAVVVESTPVVLSDSTWTGKFSGKKDVIFQFTSSGFYDINYEEKLGEGYFFIYIYDGDDESEPLLYSPDKNSDIYYPVSGKYTNMYFLAGKNYIVRMVSEDIEGNYVNSSVSVSFTKKSGSFTTVTGTSKTTTTERTAYQWLEVTPKNGTGYYLLSATGDSEFIKYSIFEKNNMKLVYSQYNGSGKFIAYLENNKTYAIMLEHQRIPGSYINSVTMTLKFSKDADSYTVYTSRLLNETTPFTSDLSLDNNYEFTITKQNGSNTKSVVTTSSDDWYINMEYCGTRYDYYDEEDSYVGFFKPGVQPVKIRYANGPAYEDTIYVDKFSELCVNKTAYAENSSIKYPNRSEGDYLVYKIKVSNSDIYKIESAQWNKVSEKSIYIFDSSNKPVESPYNLIEGKTYYLCAHMYFDYGYSKDIALSLNPDPSHKHTYKSVSQKATAEKDGYTGTQCSKCKHFGTKTVIAHPAEIKLSKTTLTYNGKVQKPTLIIKDKKGKDFSTNNYTVTFPESKAIGTYTAKVTFKGNYTGSTELSYKIAPKAPTGLKITPASTTSLKLTWTKVSGVSGYYIYDSTDKVGYYTTSNSYTINDLKAGSTHKIRVKAYVTVSGKKVSGDYSAYVTAATKPSTAKISSVTADKKAFTVKFGKVTNANGYQVTYSTSSDFKNAKSVTTTKTSLKISSLTSGKKYYVKVRAYVTVNNAKTYGTYSTVQNIKVK